MDFNVKIKIDTLPVYLCQCQYPGCDIIVLQEVTTGGSWIKDEISLRYFLQVHVNLSLPQNEKVIQKNDICGVCCASIGLRCPQASWLPNISLPHLGPPWDQSSPSPTLPGSSCCQRPHCPSGVTNLLPFCFCHPKLVVAQEEGPHGFADLWLDAPVVDETQQLPLLVTLW